MRKLAIVALSLATAFSSVAPAQAFPPVTPVKAGISNVETVQYYNRRWYRGGDRDRWGDRRYYRHRHWDDDDDDDNVGAIIGGLAAGAIIGGLLSSQPRRYYGGNSHASWCYSRYRSYRAWDNTFQPYNGPRRACYSPYR
ncbi:Lectin-like protein BA14k [Ensifer sp. M14]|uniref:BA14K family protein n=1 Tax=Sinorhizobium/Ensifer group TaxID=227292 RepID=UPI0009856B15|nr:MULTISPECIES: BA14K family protein [Sinorhizobium/Ensifer group]OOG70096.1 hypothetical protein B0E45_14650 [Sinorhizobium sp. A49]RDL49875.1 Lectin-like protein BA14k [Ensifer sp. M14]